MTTTAARSPFDDLYGLQVGTVTATSVEAHMNVSENVRQPFGLVHGGVYAAVAESLATLGTIEGIGPNQIALGLSNSTNFLRPVQSGQLRALASVTHRGRTTCVWDVAVHDDAGHLCAVARVTVAVRPRRPGDASA